MQWSEVRHAYPEQWLVIEAIEAETDETHQRLLKNIAIVERCVDGSIAMQRYRNLHQRYPKRELYFVHTRREVLDIREQAWIGRTINPP